MAGQWPKVICDPIHNLIRFDDTPLDRLLLGLIDSKPFQRLRRIKQLGFSDTVFPGATHTRFAHSIGVLWNAKRLLRRLTEIDEKLVPEKHRQVVLVAALLHDLGHGPFSHAFEKITGEKHERRTVEIILDESGEIFPALSAVDDALPQRVSSLFEDGAELVDETKLAGYECPKYLRSVMSSQLDADRWDYLIRDSHFSGTEYGRFDVDWLLEHIEVDQERDRLYVTRKALQAAEGYVFARYHMYQAVYFHKATRASEVMLRLLFGRYKELVTGAPDEEGARQIVPGAPGVIVRAFAGSINLTDYLKLDDHSITEFLKAAASASDQTLQYLAHGLLNRHLYKCIDATDAQADDPVQFGTFISEAKSKLTADAALAVDSESAFVPDQPSDIPYKFYDPDAENPATQIYVQLGTGEIKELSLVSDLVDALKKKVKLIRYYFPPEMRGVVDPIAQEYLQRRSA